MSDETPKTPVTPVLGYRPQSETQLALVNENKLTEESTLCILDELAKNPDVDHRWLAIGRTHIEQGWMAVNRSILRPTRTHNADF